MEQTATISREEVCAALEKALASTQFVNSQRNQKFLRYVVEASLNNQDESLKEFAIAADVFGRDASTDSSADATVRMETSRLRTRLQEYYAGTGRNDRIVIEIPSSGYRANFLEKSSLAVAGQSPAEAPQKSWRFVFMGALAALAGAALVTTALLMK